jgi:membrane protein
VADKAGGDNIFFMAGAIAFSVILAVVPLLMFTVGLAGYVLDWLFPDPSAAMVDLVISWLPAVGGDIDLLGQVREVIDTLLADRGGLSLLGGLFFVWLSTRLVGTLRTALREVFEIGRDRGIVQGKLFDMRIVIVAGLLVVLNLAVTVRLEALGAFGAEDVLALQGRSLEWTSTLIAHLISLGSSWVLFLLVYRYLTVRPIPWRLSLIGATFSGILQEVLKFLFSFYVTSVADYSSGYGNLTTVAVLFIWIYYGSVVFILGGEVAQVHAMSRARAGHGARAIFAERS